MSTDKPNIFFCGDNHSHFDHIVTAVETYRPDAIILLGDIEPRQPLEVELARILSLTKIHFIIGNHDTDDKQSYHFLVDSPLAKGRIDGEVRTISGVRVAGLGGIFRSKIWDGNDDRNVASYAQLQYDLTRRYRQLQDTINAAERKFANQPSDKLQGFIDINVRRLKEAKSAAEPKLLKHASTIFPDIYDRLSACKADVLVTHEAPSCHPHGFTVIDMLGRSLSVKTAFHGHHHDQRSYKDAVQTVGFQTYGVGFCGITDLYGNVIVLGETASKYN